MAPSGDDNDRGEGPGTKLAVPTSLHSGARDFWNAPVVHVGKLRPGRVHFLVKFPEIELMKFKFTQ